MKNPIPKTLFLGCLIGILFLWLSPGSQSAKQGCLSCHQGIESPGPTHRFPCERCHGGNEKGDTPEKAHQGLVSNPSAFDQASKRCLPCHQGQLSRASRSLMATSAGEINQTRYLWGAQEDSDIRYLNRKIDAYPALPKFSESGQLVDDLLRVRCLRCHLSTKGGSRYGEFRAEGCAACHMPYGADGLSQSKDRTISTLTDQIRKDPGKQKRGYPLIHQFTRAIPTRQCLTCHNGHRVGMDYVGLAERDYETSYRFLSQDGDQPSLIYGFDPRRLLPDIHFEKGLTCIDCHYSREVMGDGKIYRHSLEQVMIRCQDCHGTVGKGPVTKRIGTLIRPVKGSSSNEEVLLDSKGNPLWQVRKEAEGIFLTSKSTQQKHRIPQINKKPPSLSHRIPEHMEKMECHSCHALWSYQDFGFHLSRESRADYQKWAPLWLQNDPQVQETLQKNLPLKKEKWAPPRSRDYLDGSFSDGIWFSGWSYRRIESPILGINQRGLTSVFRPFHQFVVSQVDEKGRVALDSHIPQTRNGKTGLGFNPYAPHTIRKETLRCEGCHLNPRAIGLGNRLAKKERQGRIQLSPPLTHPSKDGMDLPFEWEALVSEKGSPLQTQTRKGARPYNLRELENLMKSSKAYKGYYTLYFQEKGLY